MRKTLRFVIGGSMLLTCAAIAWTGDEKDGRAIVLKSIEATGGEKALAKHNSFTMKEKGTFHGTGMALPYTGNYAFQVPGQFRMEIEGVFTMVFDKDKGWVSAGGDVKEMTKEQLAVQTHDQRVRYMSTLLPLKDKEFTVKKLADAKVDKVETHVVEVTRKDWPAMKIYFDKSNHFMVKLEYKTKFEDLQFKEATVDLMMSDFKEVDGAKVAHKMVMKRDGKVFVEGEVVELKTGKLDDKTFAKPN